MELMTVRAMKLEDLDDVVQIHIAAFPGFFLTRMGPRFLRAYYRAVLDFPAHLAIVAEADAPAGLAGFVVGFSDVPGFYAFFSRRRRWLLPLIALAVLRMPALMGEILHNARRVEGEARSDGAGAVELASIGTLGQGRGVGGLLLAAFSEAARAMGEGSIVLTTDAEDNEDVRRFYERRGFVAEGEEQRGTRRLCRYRLSLSPG